MHYILFGAIFLALSEVLSGHTGGEVEIRCPLDGTTFTAWQDLSGTSFGRRLDLKSLGAIASPWSLAQCPKCHLPITEEKLTPKQKAEREQIVKSPDFLHAVETGSSYAALAVVREQTHAEPFLIAQSYLQSSWQLENKDAYAQVAKSAIRWFDEAASSLSESDRHDDYNVSRYAPIELLRRTGQFAMAAERLKAFPRDKVSAESWLAGTLLRQQTLISANEAGPDEAYVWEEMNRNRPAHPRRQHSLTATNAIETALLADGSNIAGGCLLYSLEEGATEVKITLNPKTGRFELKNGTGSRISAGTELLNDTWESDGTFSLRRPDAFGGREIVFDSDGFSITKP